MRRATAFYFALLGAVMLIFGILQLVACLKNEFSVGALVIPADLWTGIILSFAGAFVFAGSTKLPNIHGLGLILLGCMMLWIVAGCDILSRLLTPIWGEEGWANSGGFLSVWQPPYIPAIYLLPFSAVVVYFARKRW